MGSCGERPVRSDKADAAQTCSHESSAASSSLCFSCFCRESPGEIPRWDHLLLRDRCPEGSSASELSSYDECIEKALKGRGQKLHTQCTTDTLRNNDKLTVPLYTDHCSAICFTKGNTRGVHD